MCKRDKVSNKEKVAAMTRTASPFPRNSTSKETSLWSEKSNPMTGNNAIGNHTNKNVERGWWT